MPNLNRPKLSTNLSPEVKAFGIPLVSVLVVIAVFMLAVLPLWNKVSSKQTELNSAQEELKKLQTKEEELQKLNVTDLENQFQIAEIALPSSKEVPALLVGISRLYQEQGMALTALKITPGKVSTESAQVKEEPGSKSPTTTPAPTAKSVTSGGKVTFASDRRLDFDLVLTGNLEQARGFLKTLEKSLRLMVVNSFAFTKSTNGSTQINLKISAPFEPFPPVPTKFSESLPTLTKDDLDNLGKLSSFTPLTTPFSENIITGDQINPFSGGGAQPFPSPSNTPTLTPIVTPPVATNSSLLGQ